MNEKDLSIFFHNVRDDFKCLRNKVNNHNLIYFDNAATTFKPKCVLNEISNFYNKYCSNIHRGIHSLSQEASEKFESTRKKTAQFINSNINEIVFTSSATQSINIIANGLEDYIKKNDEIVISILEHHANLIPWQQLCKRKKAKLKIIPICKETLEIDIEKAKKIISKKTKILAISYVSNVTGVINNIKNIISIAEKHNTITLIDASQGTVHTKIDVKKINCDFLCFSAHKMHGPSGVGILYGKYSKLKKLKPTIFGGSMIKEVDLYSSEFRNPPSCFETGTLNIEGIIGFGSTLDYLNNIGLNNIIEYEKILIQYFIKKTENLKNFKLYGLKNVKKKIPVFSFTIKNIHPHDIAIILDNYGIASRSGHHCAMPLIKKLNICATTRVSLSFYNTKEEIDKFVDVIKNVDNEIKSGKFLLDN